MPDDPNVPWAVALSQRVISFAATLVPLAERNEWLRERLAELWRRWLFLRGINAWTSREHLPLLRHALGAFPAALRTRFPDEVLRSRLSRAARSPITCLAAFAVILTIIGFASSGFQATREMLFSQLPAKDGSLTFIWLHNYLGGGDRGLPADVPAAWEQNSKSLHGVSGLAIRPLPVGFSRTHQTVTPLVITVQPGFFDILGVHPALGKVPSGDSVVLDDHAFATFAHSDAGIIGTQATIEKLNYRVAAVLPASFAFVSRQPTVYRLSAVPPVNRVFVVARVKPGVNERDLRKDLLRIMQDVCYYYNLPGRLLFSSWRGALLTPLLNFTIATLLSAVLALLVFRPSIRLAKLSFRPQNRRTAARRLLFFLTKTALILTCVFVAGLEWSRSASSLLFGSFDPGSGMLLLWLYVLGAMGGLFWSLADQRARCRVCLNLMAFPVRIGSPGSLFLGWSGMELLCSQGHGMLHVPFLAPSWDEETERWVSLDDSWRDLFAQQK